MHGYTSREEFLRVPVQGRYYDLRDRERMLNLLKSGMVKDFEVQLKRRDGTPFWALVASIPYTLESGERALITITQDITERKQAEELFRTLAESSPVSIFIIQDWKLQYVNRQFLNYTGYTADEIRDRDFETIVFPDDRDAAKKKHRKHPERPPRLSDAA